MSFKITILGFDQGYTYHQQFIEKAKAQNYELHIVTSPKDVANPMAEIDLPKDTALFVVLAKDRCPGLISTLDLLEQIDRDIPRVGIVPADMLGYFLEIWEGSTTGPTFGSDQHPMAAIAIALKRCEAKRAMHVPIWADVRIPPEAYGLDIN